MKVHELGLCDGVVQAIRRRAQGRPVSWARVRVGGHALDPEVIAQGAAMAAAGTEAEGFSLELVVEPMRTVCGRCGADEPVEEAMALAACPRCGSVDIEVTGSEHAVLEAVGYRTPGPDHSQNHSQNHRQDESQDESNHSKEDIWTPT